MSINYISGSVVRSENIEVYTTYPEPLRKSQSIGRAMC